MPGNTVASFKRAVEVGVDLIEFDVLWTPDGDPRRPAGKRTPLVVAHDWPAAAAGPAPTLAEVLAAFARPPLDRVAVNLDLKLPGREDEVVELLHAHGLAGRASISTMEIPTLERIAVLDSGLPLGWTVPRATRDWTASRWLRPVLAAGAATLRRRLPGQVADGIPRLGAGTVWAWHGVVSPRLVAAVHAAGASLNAWTVDDRDRIEQLRELGVDGIVSNDPRLLQP